MKSVCVILYIPDISVIFLVLVLNICIFFGKKKALLYVILSSPYFSNLLL